MAQGVIKSGENRIAAILARNVGDLEDEIWQLQQDWESKDAYFNAMQAAMEQAGLRVLNTPNLLKQPQFTTRNYPTSEVITETLTIPVEDATAAAETLTFTITNEAITANHVVHGVKSSNYNVAWYSMVTGTAAAGSMTISVAARPDAHDAAVTLTVYLCTVASQTVPYGEIAHSWATGVPYLDSVSNGSDYPGQEGDQITESVVTLTGNDIVTEPDGTTYDKAIAFTVTDPPSSGWGNADKIVFNYPSSQSIEMENDQPKYRRYGQLDMVVGEHYTLSVWARVTSGTKACLWLGCEKYWKVPDGYSYIDIEAKNGQWQRVEFEFDFNPTGDEFYTYTSDNKTYQGCNWVRNVAIGVCRKYAGTVQLCGFRLVRGKTFISETYDELNEDMFTVRQRVTALETTAEGIPGSISAAKASVLSNIAASDTETATAAHAVDELIIVNGTLYRVTSAIATGETIAAGTNVTAVTVAELIAAILGLPAVTSSDNGKVLRVSNGAWAAESLPSASGVSF